jgi:RNA polymerase sigma factor (sigma-70 family)
VDNADLLDRVGRGESQAWDELVGQFAGLVWSVARTYRLGRAATDDVVQTVWLRLAEHCGRIREPERLAAWLATTTRNEALRMIRQSARTTASGDDRLFDGGDATSPSMDERIIDRDDRTEVMAAFRELSPDDQQLLRLLCTVPPLDYETIAEMIGRPIGSIGPTRARCLERLRRLLAGAPGHKDGTAS